MYYLIKETLGRKKCIDRNINDGYADYQFYDCLKSFPFDEINLGYLRSIRIRCIASPGKLTLADVYVDSEIISDDRIIFK